MFISFRVCNGIDVFMNPTTSAPNFVISYDLDKDLYIVGYIFGFLTPNMDSLTPKTCEISPNNISIRPNLTNYVSRGLEDKFGGGKGPAPL